MAGSHHPILPIRREERAALGMPQDQYDADGYLILHSPTDARNAARAWNANHPDQPVSASGLYGAAFICMAWNLILEAYNGNGSFEQMAASAAGHADPDILKRWPNDGVWFGRISPAEAVRETAPLTKWTLARTASANPAFRTFQRLFSDDESTLDHAWNNLEKADEDSAVFGPENASPLETLRRPIMAAPDSIEDQLHYILTRWGAFLGFEITGFMSALDMIAEETRPHFDGPGPVELPSYDELDGTAQFSHDHHWMPKVVLLAKNVLVWLAQLSTKYERPITTLDAVPDEELDLLASRGFNALWLIGLWERSPASCRIKQRMGNPEAAASAYSLFGYTISSALGGGNALTRLRERTAHRGIRLSSDMVPNHVGIDSEWVRFHPERLLSVKKCPSPGYTFNSSDLSGDENVDIRLEDHYWNKTDAAVVFKRTEKSTGKTDYIYHGNDGTSIPWNDTAQIDFLNPEAREAVIQDILRVAGDFSLIRFDAAMVLASRHIRRLWHPAPGTAGAVPSRAEHALSEKEFKAALGGEFWRDVVDRVAKEAPGTLLLAEAFWMMEGFFVRSLGMHRVYNSAFMNMLRDGSNAEYRGMIKETLSFDPGILQRFVNFMNNPDEETAVTQFGKDDRYFAVCTLLATLPGLPMFGHGQIEGFSEKYGMEYTRAYLDESPDLHLEERHRTEIFPLLARRGRFAGAAGFRLYDVKTSGGGIEENIFAHSNAEEHKHCLVLVNNSPNHCRGIIRRSAPVNIGGMKILNEDLADGLGLGGCHNSEWILMKEFLSGLWYLRSAREIKKEGLEVSLNPYGRQIFLDFRRESETPDGIWAGLAAEFNGAGMKDPDSALREFRLRPLRTELDALITDNVISSLAGSIKRGSKPGWPESDADFAAKISRLMSKHHESVRVGEFTKEPDVIKESIKSKLVAAARLHRLIGGRLLRLLNNAYPESAGNDTEFMVVYAVISSLTAAMKGMGTRSPWDLWCLELWLSARKGHDMAQRMSLALGAGPWCRTVHNPGKQSPPGSNTAREALSTLMAKRIVREHCGVNTWNGVVWYSREGWDATVRTLMLSAAVESGSLFKGLVRRGKLIAVFRKWKAADRRSEYRLDSLLAASR